MSMPRPVVAKGVSLPKLCYHPRATGNKPASCDDKIALVEYTMAGHETSGLGEIADQIDVRGLQCPLPVLKARKRLKTLNHGDLLKVFVTDPAAIIDFPHFCNEAGHDLVSSDEADGILTFVIRKSHTK